MEVDQDAGYKPQLVRSQTLNNIVDLIVLSNNIKIGQFVTLSLVLDCLLRCDYTMKALKVVI